MSITINKSPETVRAIYLDYPNWNKTFALTINSAHLVKKVGHTLWILVHHKKEGFVQNELTALSKDVIVLKECKPKYNAIFYNHFDLHADRTIYRVEAFIYLKGIFRLFRPIVFALAKRRVQNYVLAPVKKASEAS